MRQLSENLKNGMLMKIEVYFHNCFGIESEIFPIMYEVKIRKLVLGQLRKVCYNRVNLRQSFQ